jgi:hypothetical protein
VCGLPEPAGQHGVAVDLDACGPKFACFDQVDHPPRARPQVEIEVAHPARHRLQLVGERRPAGKVVGSPEHPAGGERVGQRAVVPRGVRDPDRLAAERVPDIVGDQVVPRLREPREHAGAQGSVAVRRQPVPSLLEQLDQLRVEAPDRRRSAEPEGGSRQPEGVAARAGEVGGGQERPPRRLRLPSPHPRVSQPQLQVAAPVDGGGGRVEVEDAQRGFEVARRLLPTQHRHGPLSRPLRRPQRPRAATQRRGTQVVGGDRGQVLGRVAVQRLDRLPGPAVQPRQPLGGQALVEDVADQGVREAVAPRRTRIRCEQPGVDRVLERGQQAATLQPGDPRHHLERELLPHHRGHLQGRAGIGRQQP